MTEFSIAVRSKLASLVRLLASDRDGEVVAAARAIPRVLKAAGADIHVLAAQVEQANGKRFSEADAAEIYRRGVEDGKREAESGPMFRNVNLDGEPSWHEIAVECAAHPNRLLHEREKQFVKDMVRRTVHGGEPTERQASWLRKIYARVQR